MTQIPFKAVAVDLDGTFLTEKKTFDHALFAKVLRKLQANQIPFICATGNQLIRSHEYFDEFTNEVDYVSENGAILEADGKVFKRIAIDYKIAQKLLHFIQTEYPEAIIMVSAQHHCYILKSMDQADKDDIRIYYRDVQEIDRFTDIDPADAILKVCLTADDELAQVIQDRFNEKYGENDIDMLKACGYSYAMKNANAKAKAVAKYEAPTNDENGVLKVLAKYLDID